MRLLFVPVSGGDGSGEARRCQLLADAMQALRPEIEAHFLLAQGTPAPRWPTRFLSASPTRAVNEVVDAIETLRPDVVVFDGNARVAALAAARRLGARTVLVSSRPSARDRGFRGRRLRRLSEHWLVGVELAEPTWRERIATRFFPRVVVRRFGTLFAPPTDAATVLVKLGIDKARVVVCPGGGGHVVAGRSAVDIFAAAAAAIAGSGTSTVAVATPAAAPAITAGELPNAELMALLAQADAALLGGGSLLPQALALGVPVVALPLQQEQAARVDWLAQHGAALRATGADADALAADIARLLDDAALRTRLREAAAALWLRNGLDAAVAALIRLVDAGQR